MTGNHAWFYHPSTLVGPGGGSRRTGRDGSVSAMRYVRWNVDAEESAAKIEHISDRFTTFGPESTELDTATPH
jgi:hypothetical protein